MDPATVIRIAIFEAIQLGVSFYAITRGGAPERAIGIMLLVAALATLLIPIDQLNPYWTVEWNRLSVDVALLAALLAVALRANRFWPLWIAALQLVTLGVHGVRVYDPAVLPVVYARLTSQVAYPICAVLLIGTWRFHRRQRRAPGREPDWSPFHW